MSMKASELRAKLKKAGLGAEDTERIVGGEINLFKSSGGKEGVEDDGFSGTISVQALIDASEELRTRAGESPEVKRAGDSINKGGVALPEDLSDMLRATTANTEAIIEYTQGLFPAIAKGQLELSRVVEGLVSQVAAQDAIIKGMSERLRQPVAPRGVGAGSAPLPLPSETPEAKAARSRINRSQLKNALRMQHQDLIRKGGDGEMISHLGKAIGKLENSTDSTEAIIAEFNIEFTEGAAAA